jgi:hypothetical protein
MTFLSASFNNANPGVVPMRPRLPVCPICNKTVPLETAVIDENGHAMHEECYLLKLRREPIENAY